MQIDFLFLSFKSCMILKTIIALYLIYMYIKIFMKLKCETMNNERIQSSFTSQTLTFNVFWVKKRLDRSRVIDNNVYTLSCFSSRKIRPQSKIDNFAFKNNNIIIEGLFWKRKDYFTGKKVETQKNNFMRLRRGKSFFRYIWE